MAYPEFESTLIRNGVLRPIAHETCHVLDSELDDHFANSLEVYPNFELGRLVGEAGSGTEARFGTGRVMLLLANNVRLVLDELIYDPLRRYDIKPFKPRVAISLRKLSRVSGTTFKEERTGHWHVMRNGQLLVFGMKSEQCLPSTQRVTLGPPLPHRIATASSQALRGAISVEPAENAARSLRAAPTAAIRSTTEEFATPRRIAVPSKPTEPLPITSSTLRSASSIGAEPNPRMPSPTEPAWVPLDSRVAVSPTPRLIDIDRRQPTLVQNIAGIWISAPQVQSTLPAAGVRRVANHKPGPAPEKAPVGSAKSGDKNDAKGSTGNPQARGAARAGKGAESNPHPNPCTHARMPVPQKPAKNKSTARKPSSPRRRSLLDRVLGPPIESVSRDIVHDKNGQGSTKAQAAARQSSSRREVPERSTARVPVEQAQGSVGERCSKPERRTVTEAHHPSGVVISAAAKAPLKQGPSADGAREAASNRWSRLSPSDFPRASEHGPSGTPVNSVARPPQNQGSGAESAKGAVRKRWSRVSPRDLPRASKDNR